MKKKILRRANVIFLLRLMLLEGSRPQLFGDRSFYVPAVLNASKTLILLVQCFLNCLLWVNV